MQGENARLKNYLLGEISPEERAEVEMRIITDESFADEMSLAESDLMEDYLENTLSDEKTRLFHANFLTSPERKDELKELSLIKGYAKQVSFSAAESTKSEEADRKGSLERRNWFFLNWRPVAAVCAILVIGLISLGVWRAFFNTQMSPLETDYASLNRRDLSDAAVISKYSSVSLIPGTLRDVNGPAKLKAEGFSDSVLFRLALPTGVDAGFDAEIVRDGQKMFAVERIKTYQNGTGGEIRLLLPKSILTKGQFQIKLRDTGGKATPIIYNFAVE